MKVYMKKYAFLLSLSSITLQLPVYGLDLSLEFQNLRIAPQIRDGEGTLMMQEPQNMQDLNDESDDEGHIQDGEMPVAQQDREEQVNNQENLQDTPYVPATQKDDLQRFAR